MTEVLSALALAIGAFLMMFGGAILAAVLAIHILDKIKHRIAALCLLVEYIINRKKFKAWREQQIRTECENMLQPVSPKKTSIVDAVKADQSASTEPDPKSE